MRPTQRRNPPRKTRYRPPPIGDRVRRRSPLAFALTGIVVLGASGVVAARAPDRSPATGGGAPGSRTTTVRPVAPAAGVPDVPWLAEGGDGRWIFGRGEHGAVRRLPAEETGLAIDERFVATTLAGSDRHSIVRFRDRSSGRTALDVGAPIWVSGGAWTTDGLVVTGYGDSSATSDGGLLLVSPDDGSLRVLVAGGPFLEGLGRPVARGGVEVSASGRTVASNACGVERCDLQVVRLATGVVTRPIAGGDGFLRAVTDDTVVTTDGDGRWISGRRIADGAETWRHADRALIDPMALADGSVVGLVGSRRAGWAVSTLVPGGELRDVTSRVAGDRPPPRLWRTVSSPEALVIGPTSFEEAIEGGRAARITIVTPGPWRSTDGSISLPVATEAVP